MLKTSDFQEFSDFFRLNFHNPEYDMRDRDFGLDQLLRLNKFCFSREKREELVKYNLLLERNDLEIVKQVGSGHFGDVHEALLRVNKVEKRIKVAVKMLKHHEC